MELALIMFLCENSFHARFIRQKYMKKQPYPSEHVKNITFKLFNPFYYPVVVFLKPLMLPVPRDRLGDTFL